MGRSGAYPQFSGTRAPLASVSVFSVGSNRNRLPFAAKVLGLLVAAKFLVVVVLAMRAAQPEHPFPLLWAYL